MQQAPQQQPMQPPGMMMQQYFSQPVPVTQLQQPPAPVDAATHAPAAPAQPQQPYPQAPMQQGELALRHLCSRNSALASLHSRAFKPRFAVCLCQ